MLLTQTTVRSGSRRRSISGDVTSDRFHGSSSVRSTTTIRGHPARSRVAGGCTTPRSPAYSTTAVSVGAGDTSTYGTPARRHRSTTHVTGVPGRRAFLLQRLVVLVDHDRCREVGTRRPGSGAGPDHDVDTTGRVRPVVGDHGDRQPGPTKPRRQQRHRVVLGNDDQRRTTPHRRQDRRHHVGPRRQPQYSPAGAEQVACRRRGGTGSRARAPIGRQRHDGTTGRRRHEERPDPARRPADRRPLGQVEQLRRTVRGPSPSAIGFSAIGSRVDRRPSAGASSIAATQPPIRRPWSSTRTSVPTPTCGDSSCGTR